MQNGFTWDVPTLNTWTADGYCNDIRFKDQASCEVTGPAGYPVWYPATLACSDPQYGSDQGACEGATTTPVWKETMPYSTRVLITLCCLIFAAGAAWAADAVVQLGAGDGFVVQDSAATERLRVDEQGNLHRNGQLFVHDGGVTDNTYLGNGAGANSGATAIRNTGFGFGALNALTSGDNNSAFGYEAVTAVLHSPTCYDLDVTPRSLHADTR